VATNCVSEALVGKYKTPLTNPCLFVFRNGYPFVSYIVLAFHCTSDALIFFLSALLSVLRRGHDTGPLSDFVSGSRPDSNGHQQSVVMPFFQSRSSQDV
jgi:hypothetical protein